MKKETMKIAAGVLAALTIASCGGGGEGSGGAGTQSPNSEGVNAEGLTVGLVYDETGPSSSYNVPATELIKALIEDLNEDGGLLGEEITYVEANDESDPTKASTMVNKVAAEGADVIFYNSGGASTIQAKPSTVELEIPTLAATNAESQISLAPDNEYIYTLATGSEQWGEAYCAGIENAGWETMGILMDDTPAISTFSETLLPSIDCVEVVSEQTAPEDGTSFGGPIARLAESDPDFVMVLAAGAPFEVKAHAALKAQMPETPRLSTAAMVNTPSSWDVARDGALEGVIAMGSVDLMNERTAEVAEQLENLGDGFDMTQFNANAYDAFQLVVEAVERAGTTDSNAINEELQNTEEYVPSYGLEGLTLSFTEEKHSAPDSQCSLILLQFGEDNSPGGAWDKYVPECGS